jgi:hypothetical protein
MLRVETSTKRQEQQKLKKPTILFAGLKMAAALLDIKPAQFRGLVDLGILPGPTIIGGYERWDVELLQTIVRGEAAVGEVIIEW